MAVSCLLLSGVGACAALSHQAPPVRITAIKPPPSSAEAINDIDYRSAARAIERRDYARALDLLQRARARQPADIRVLNAFGVVYDKLGRFDLSARYYAQAQTIDPTSAIVRNNMAYSLALQGLVAGHAEPTALASVSPAVRLAAVPAPATAVSAGASLVGSEAAPLELAAISPVARLAALHDEVVRVRASPVAAPPMVTASSRVVAATANGPRIVLQARAPVTYIRATPPRMVNLAAATVQTGRPLVMVDASGKAGAAEPLRLALARLGWSTPKSAARRQWSQARTTIRYAQANLVVARALARTLPGRAVLVACPGKCLGVRLIIGADAATWKIVPPRRHRT